MVAIRNAKSKSIYVKGNNITHAMFKLESYYRDFPKGDYDVTKNEARNHIIENFANGFFEIVTL